MNGYCRMGDVNRAISVIEHMENLGLRSYCAMGFRDGEEAKR